MRKRYYTSCTIICFLLLGCSSDDENGGINPGGGGTGDLIIETIIGNWIATSAQFTTTNANPVQTRDVVADGGFCDFNVSQNNSFTLVVRNPGFPDPQITTGLLVADGDFIDVRFDTDPSTDVRWDFSISGDNLAITGPIDYDFENDGIFEATSANLQFIPN